MSAKPNLFICGAPKSGTSAMAAYLDNHPQVFFSKPKEPFYWSFDYPGLRQNLKLETLDDYLALFAEATGQHQMIGEGSTNYLRSECAIEKILQFNANARFIVMLRNPIEVVQAYHSENLFARWEDEPDFEVAWRSQDKRLRNQNIPRNCPAPQLLQYRSLASYPEQIRNFFRQVPPEQRQVIVFDDFKADTRAVFNRTVDFLQLSPFEMESFERVNAAHGHRSQMLAKLVLDPPKLLKPAVETVRHFLRKFQGGLIEKAKKSMRSAQKRPQLRPEFREELSAHFALEIEELSHLLGRDLTHWVATSTTQSEQPLTDVPLERVVSGGAI